jgi:hypothetical protein
VLFIQKVQIAKVDYTSPSTVCVGAGVKSVAAASLQEKHVRPGCGSDLGVPAADQAAGAAATRAVLAAAAAAAALTPGMGEGTLKTPIPYCRPVLRIWDVYPGSRIRLFSIPDPGSELSPSRILDPHQRIDVF